VCHLCPGSYQPQSAQAVCLNCDAGTFSSASGLSSFSGNCAPGTYSNSSATMCVNCSLGFYQPQSSQKSASHVLQGNFALPLVFCAPPVIVLEERNSQSGSSNCSLCPDKMYSSDRSDACGKLEHEELMPLFSTMVPSTHSVSVLQLRNDFIAGIASVIGVLTRSDCHYFQ